MRPATIRSSASTLRDSCCCRKRVEQTEVGVEVPAGWLRRSFRRRLVRPEAARTLPTDPINCSSLTTQTGEVTSRGIELEAVANLAPGLKVARLVHQLPSVHQRRTANPALIGQTPTNTPQQLASGWADYTFQDGWLRGFGFGGGVRYVGASFADQANTLAVPSRVLGDLAVHYDWQNWRFAVNASNVTDEIYVASCAGPIRPASMAIGAA